MTTEIKIVNRGTALRMGDGLVIAFQRTLRIPDDGRRYPLPPGLGAFPLRRVRDYAGRVPDGWEAQGGVFLPMFQREAMWLSFGGAPRALQVGVGKVCAISGGPWRDELSRDPQNYVVTGRQPWLDGIAAGAGTIRQFVAMPLGLGYTVEAQVTGEERFGGIQLQAFDPKPGRVPEPPRRGAPAGAALHAAPGRRCRGDGAMGLAAGGRMTQKIYPDPHGPDAWDPATRRRVFVHVVNSELWREITGEAPPRSPISARRYADAGLPWFSLYDEGAPTLDVTPTLAKVKSVKELDAAQGGHPLQDDAPVVVGPVATLAGDAVASVVDDGAW